jgi:hypothetical protein
MGHYNEQKPISQYNRRNACMIPLAQLGILILAAKSKIWAIIVPEIKER